MPLLLIPSCYHKETCIPEQQLWHRPAGSPTLGSCLCRLAPLWDSACHKSSSTDCAFHAAWTQPLPLPALHLLSRPAATWEVLEEGAVAGDQWWRDVNILAKQLIRTTPPWNNLPSPEQRDRGRRKEVQRWSPPEEADLPPGETWQPRPDISPDCVALHSYISRIPANMTVWQYFFDSPQFNIAVVECSVI